MPYDYPGEYALRFDGVDVGRFRELVAIPAGGQPRSDGAALSRSGPGTIELHDLGGANLYGDVLLERWQKSPTPTGTPPNVIIAKLGGSGSLESRWLLRNARPVEWVMKPLGMRSTGGTSPAIEKVTLVHEGIILVR